jgi:hypothetical protein
VSAVVLTVCLMVLVAAPRALRAQSNVELDQWALRSPEGNIKVQVHRSPFTYSVTYNGHPVVIDSPLGLDLKDQAPFEDLKLIGQRHQAVDVTATPVWGKNRQDS